LFAEIISDQLGWELTGNTFDWLTKIPIEFAKRKIIFTDTKAAKFYPEIKFIKPAYAKMFPAKYMRQEHSTTYLMYIRNIQNWFKMTLLH
jgi:hypothetical protein